ncbi:MAG TPA: sensor histidine kinase [Trebonia sp.]|nr:sensor histidine kinase [Trebonia sp.]
MSSLGSRYWLETWRRGAPARTTVVQLVILLALTPSALSGSFGAVWINLLLCLGAAGWSLLALHPGLRKRPRVAAVFVAGVVTVSLVLSVRDGWFGFYAYAGYMYSIVLLPWPWPLYGVAATATVATTAQTYGIDKATPAGAVAYAGVLAANMLAICGATWFLHRTETQYAQRGQMLEELQETNRKLEAALAENAGLQRQLVVQAREAGMLDERQRMAREIHDTLAQGLTGIIAQLQAAEHAADDPAEWRKHNAAATMLARDSLSEARRSVNALRPQPLERAPLSEALAGVAARWSALHGIRAHVETTGTARPIAPDAEVALLRTAQEALANVARHARATAVWVTLSYLDGEIALDVRDDGTGFAPDAALPDPHGTESQASPAVPDGRGGFGLIAMRQRVERLAGTLEIESEPGTGTGISAHIPAAAAEAAR